MLLQYMKVIKNINRILIILFLFMILIVISNAYMYEGMNTDYDFKKFDVEYHSNLDIDTKEGSWLQHNGKIVFYPWTKIANEYSYSNKKKKYGKGQYVPSYEDSIYLSFKGGKQSKSRNYIRM